MDSMHHGSTAAGWAGACCPASVKVAGSNMPPARWWSPVPDSWATTEPACVDALELAFGKAFGAFHQADMAPVSQAELVHTVGARCNSHFAVTTPAHASPLTTTYREDAVN